MMARRWSRTVASDKEAGGGCVRRGNTVKNTRQGGWRRWPRKEVAELGGDVRRNDGQREKNLAASNFADPAGGFATTSLTDIYIDFFISFQQCGALSCHLNGGKWAIPSKICVW